MAACIGSHPQRRPCLGSYRAVAGGGIRTGDVLKTLESLHGVFRRDVKGAGSENTCGEVAVVSLDSRIVPRLPTTHSPLPSLVPNTELRSFVVPPLVRAVVHCAPSRDSRIVPS